MPLSEKSKKLISDSYKKMNFSEEKLEKLSILYDLIVETNEKLNITTITDETPFLTRHIIDSLSVFLCEEIVGKTEICDIGCGGGFPGLPIAIANKNVKVTMIDSTEKKISALKVNAEKLSLSNVEAISGRGEEMASQGKMYREKFDVCVSRAVARLSVLSELCIPFVKCGGYFIALKGQRAQEELSECKNTFSKLGAKLVECRKIELPVPDISQFNDEEKHEIEEYFSSDRYLVILKKTKPTEKQYPRKWSQIIKKPL